MSEKCSECGEPVDDEWIVCPDCGAALSPTSCEGCGKELKPNWKACPHCGRKRDDDGAPDLPDEDELDRADEPTPEQKRKAQRLLGEFETAITEYAREMKPEFGKGFAMLFGAAKVPSPERCFDLRQEIYDALDEHEAQYEGPFWDEILCKKKSDPDNIIAVLRAETRYIASCLDLTLGASDASARGADKFTCPGCGERATAKNASLCPTCNQYVHNDCAVKGFVRWSCPVCETGLVGQT